MKKPNKVILYLNNFIVSICEKKGRNRKRATIYLLPFIIKSDKTFSMFSRRIVFIFIQHCLQYHFLYIGRDSSKTEKFVFNAYHLTKYSVLDIPPLFLEGSGDWEDSNLTKGPLDFCSIIALFCVYLLRSSSITFQAVVCSNHLKKINYY